MPERTAGALSDRIALAFLRRDVLKRCLWTDGTRCGPERWLKLECIAEARKYETQRCRNYRRHGYRRVLIIVVVLLLLFGGGWYGRGRWY